ncbi:MAG TPA: chaperone modulator CbpM [Pyrinomonadaceae bacterium]|jgi:chaperone modulatory protein CbpM|nr:chaperone modulator CbpM [Pyrinomonadaceae bacterium]
MSEEDLRTATDVDSDEPLTPERVAEAVGARVTLVVRLARLGVLETLAGARGETLLPQRAVLRLRRMQRLRRDLGVNFAGASIILDLVEELEVLRRAHRAQHHEDFVEG